MTISVGLERISLYVYAKHGLCALHTVSQPASQPAMKRTQVERKRTREREKKNAQHVELSTNDDDDDDDGYDEMNSLTYSKCRRPTRSTHHFQSWLFYCNFCIIFSCDFFFLLSFIFNSFFFLHSNLLILLLYFQCIAIRIKTMCNKVLSSLDRVSHSNNTKNAKMQQNLQLRWCLKCVCWLVVFAMIIFFCCYDYYYCLPTQQTEKYNNSDNNKWYGIVCQCTVDETTNQKVCRRLATAWCHELSYCQTNSIWSNNLSLFCTFRFARYFNFFLLKEYAQTEFEDV